MSVAAPNPPAVLESLPVASKMSVQEYLERERHSEIRHEYVAGERIPMPGTSLAHNQIAGNLYSFLSFAFRDRDCVAYISDVRLRVSPDRYRYPDVMALCGEPSTDRETPPSLLNPALIVEVLSPSTFETDLRVKWDEYREIATVTDYLTVASDQVRVTHYVREGLRQWRLTDYVETGDALTFAALDVTISLADLYRKVAFLPAAPESATPTTTPTTTS